MSKKAGEIRRLVRNGYARVAKRETSCCSPDSCCGNRAAAKDMGKGIGYSDAEMNAVPEGANLGLGCGNPVAIAEIKAGDTVLDLGSGAGFDAFLAAGKVGRTGRVIGVDMTPEMVDKAKANAQKGGFPNVEFRLGEIEQIPLADDTVDVIISNCVINLSPEKERVFQEAYRVLKPGGRLMVSDLVLERELPRLVRESVEAYVGCLAGAIRKQAYLDGISKAGFQDVKVVSQSNYPIEAMANDITAQAVKDNPMIKPADLSGIKDSVASIKVRAVKPRKTRGAGQ